MNNIYTFYIILLILFCIIIFLMFIKIKNRKINDLFHLIGMTSGILLPILSFVIFFKIINEDYITNILLIAIIIGFIISTITIQIGKKKYKDTNKTLEV